MTRSTRPSRRGVALLLVLAALVVTVTALAAFARLAGASAVATNVNQQAQLADDLARAAEATIVDWLETESAEVVLPPDALTPMVPVLEDEWEMMPRDSVTQASGPWPARIRITAWDQEGMAPLTMLMGASPIRLGVPEDVRRAVDELELQGAPGLDAFEAPFPSRPAPEASNSSGNERPALGALVATHNPLPDDLGSGRRTRRNAPARLNVSTAPIELIAAAMRAEQRGGLEQVTQARARGERPNISDNRAAGSEADLLLVNSSSTWSFRVDAEIGTVERSWWTVWTRTGTEWEVVQRLAVDE